LKILKQIKRFMLDESGLETVEWAIVGGVVVAVGAALFLAIGTDVSEGIQGLLNSTSQIPAP
jgi:pilus assembly protein Flp/PilA